MTSSWRRRGSILHHFGSHPVPSATSTTTARLISCSQRARENMRCSSMTAKGGFALRPLRRFRRRITLAVFRRVWSAQIWTPMVGMISSSCRIRQAALASPISVTGTTRGTVFSRTSHQAIFHRFLEMRRSSSLRTSTMTAGLILWQLPSAVTVSTSPSSNRCFLIKAMVYLLRTTRYLPEKRVAAS